MTVARPTVLPGLRASAARLSEDVPPNARVILAALRRSPCAIADLESHTGLTALTIRRHLDGLVQQGLVRIAGLGPSNGGRLPRLYALAAERCLTLAVHLRFPGAVVGVVDLQGRVVARRQVSLRGDEDPEVALRRVVAAGEELLQNQDARFTGIGVALPGYADLAGGIALRIGRAPAWRDVPLAEVLERRLGLPVVLVHDTAAMALAEHDVGDAATEAHFAFVLAEEGVSAGLFLDGTVHQGMFGNAGSIGHMTIRPGGRRCHCGNRGCVEAYASTAALAERAAQMRGRAVRPLPPAQVLRRALQGQQPDRAVLADALEVLGIAIANLAKILELGAIFIGGYPSALPDDLRAAMVETARAHLPLPLRASLEIRPSRLPEAGLVGAAVPVIRRFLGAPGRAQ